MLFRSLLCRLKICGGTRLPPQFGVEHRITGNNEPGRRVDQGVVALVILSVVGSALAVSCSPIGSC